MNADDPQPHERCDGPADPLDRLLAAARWQEPPAASEARLRAFWADVSPARERTMVLRFPARRWAAAAAVIALGAAVAWFVVSRQHRPTHPEVVSPVKPEPVKPAPGSAPKVSPGPERLTPRAPTYREKLVMAGAGAQYRAKDRRARLVERVDEAVAGMAADSAADPAALLAELRRPPAPVPPVPQDLLVARLVALARTGNPALRPAAARLLAGLRLRSTLPAFVELARQPETKAVAYEQVVAMADDATLARLAQGEADAHHRRRLLAALVDRDRPQAIVAYLRQVADSRTAAHALDALAEVERPPVDSLVAQLGNPDARIRFAAAKALGRINGPAVTSRLAALVERDVHRREALAALMYSRGKEAARYLDAARRYPELAAAIDSVQVQTSRSF